MTEPQTDHERRVAERRAEREAEDEAVTDEMIQAAIDAVNALQVIPQEARVYTAAYQAMRRAKREAELRLASSNWVLKVFKPLPKEEAAGLREYLP